ncbi:DUF1764-domain-containing protein [Imleria badia]|nr:DUF1764-domain-containing protein [Imleria badia]
MSRSEIDDIFAAPKKKIKTSPKTESHHPETILDPSKKQPEPAQKRRREKKADNDRFKDSRGFAPRRKTVDGFNIYKEDELGISTTGGDTPLCPFDCQCCF